jgi:spore maturation protein CgeB
VFLDTKEELLQKCRYYLNENTLRNEIKENGLEKVYKAGHDHSSRLIDVLKKVYQ